MNYLGIDWGQKKIGLAIASGEMKIASPILTLSFHSFSEVVSKLKEIIEKEKIDVIVIGEPVSLSGGKKLAESYKSFVAELEGLGVKIEFEDERLSTRLAERLKREFRGAKKVSDDEIAAAAILQSYLDRLNSPLKIRGARGVI
ncbi:Holliday junction resolvase RuvX [Candidatus Falkowbacteria bacterium]|nr:Holliday junction resolvase RuvX [Candidatus Falkowbacteria bacterium]